MQEDHIPLHLKFQVVMEILQVFQQYHLLVVVVAQGLVVEVEIMVVLVVADIEAVTQADQEIHLL